MEQRISVCILGYNIAKDLFTDRSPIGEVLKVSSYESSFGCRIIGVGIGFICYHGAIWAATKFMSSLEFEWTMNWFAFFLSLISILLVGILSGVFPALKAEKLQVIEALRSE